MIRTLLLTSLLACCASSLAAPPAELTSVGERSGFTRTGRYDEVPVLAQAFEKHYPDAVRVRQFGTTPERRPMLEVVVTRTGAFDAATARARGIPVLLLQGGIHAGEIDGKDAGFLALRHMLDGEVGTGVLDRVVIVFVPVFNVDGHERFKAWNRPNQRGPEEMGWRTTAQNYNLNRDYAKADSREMQHMLELVGTWDPIAMADLHVTDGAQFEHDVSIQVEPLHAGDPAMAAAGRALRDGVMERLRAQGSLPLPFYPSFVVDDDPSSGFVDGVAPPRFSTGYFHLRNRFAMLVETHSWRPYDHRVRVTRNLIVALAKLTARNGRDWLRLARDADARAAQLAGQPVALAWKATERSRVIDFRGYAYTRTPSDISGALMTRYDERTPQVWKTPIRDEIVPDFTVPAPRGGYIVPVAYADQVARKLQVHGIRFHPIDRTTPLAGTFEVFRADKATFSAASFEGHQTLALVGAWKPERREVLPGALFVPIAQPKARLAMALLEPQAQDSFAAWGFFNGHFEQKEYMNDYVAEDVAREMLARDPALRAAFDRRVAEDPAFAKSPAARLAFFARRHASWDEQFELYPVLRTDVVPPLPTAQAPRSGR